MSRATIHIVITPEFMRVLKKMTMELEDRELAKKRKRKRVTKEYVCDELLKRMREKGVV